MGNSVFMSIKQIHIDRILKRIKNHEFRTKRPKGKFEYIIVYVPTPLKEIKYILKVKEPITTPNKILIDGYGNEKFNKEDNVYEIKQSIGLDELREEFNFTAPQSFTYGEKHRDLLEYIEKIGIKKLY